MVGEDKERYIDPVCGMLVSMDTPFNSIYKNRDYYFCSEKCKELFEQEPELFVSMMKKREDSIDKERVDSLMRMADELTHKIRNPLIHRCGSFHNHSVNQNLLTRPDSQEVSRLYMLKWNASITFFTRSVQDLSPIFAAAAMSFSSVSVAGNALRLRRVKL